jgi:hypothetical protein
VEFDIEFHPRTAIKVQVLVDFIVEFNNLSESEELLEGYIWIAYVDRSSTKSCSGARVVLVTLDMDEVLVALKLDFLTTNNEAKYEVVLTRLGIAKHLRAKNKCRN